MEFNKENILNKVKAAQQTTVVCRAAFTLFKMFSLLNSIMFI